MPNVPENVCSASAAAETDRNHKLFFGDNAPQSVVDLFTRNQPVK
jgi:hypothetical protein